MYERLTSLPRKFKNMKKALGTRLTNVFLWEIPFENIGLSVKNFIYPGNFLFSAAKTIRTIYIPIQNFQTFKVNRKQSLFPQF